MSHKRKRIKSRRHPGERRPDSSVSRSSPERLSPPISVISDSRSESAPRYLTLREIAAGREYRRGLKLAFQPRISTVTGAGKGIKRDFQSPSVFAHSAISRDVGSRATNDRRRRSPLKYRLSQLLYVGAARSGRIRRRGLKTRSNFAVRSLLNSILPVAAIAIGGRLVLGMYRAMLSEVPRQQRPCLASPGGHPFPSRRSRGSQRASLSRQFRSWASSCHSRP